LRQQQLAQQQQQQAALLKQRQQQQAEQLRQQQQAQAEQLRQQQEAAAAAKQKALQEHQAAVLQRQQQQAQAEQIRQQQQAAAAAAAQQQQQQQHQQDATKGPGAVGSGAAVVTSGTATPTTGLDIISGLGGLSLNNSAGAVGNTKAVPIIGSVDPSVAAVSLGNNNAMLLESFATIPQANEQERNRPYTPQNPYPSTPPSYPSTPSTLFDNPAIFEKLGTDALFFIFYYQQGTHQQYLAARELKKQSWRFHKKYMTWFQRHEEPKITTDEYEQGTYVYFDYETGWCTRIKQDFRFEYSFLEDSLQ
jgi:CCR4-NOT transcription complex subunit 3